MTEQLDNPERPQRPGFWKQAGDWVLKGFAGMDPYAAAAYSAAEEEIKREDTAAESFTEWHDTVDPEDFQQSTM